MILSFPIKLPHNFVCSKATNLSYCFSADQATSLHLGEKNNNFLFLQRKWMTSQFCTLCYIFHALTHSLNLSTSPWSLAAPYSHLVLYHQQTWIFYTWSKLLMLDVTSWTHAGHRHQKQNDLFIPTLINPERFNSENSIRSVKHDFPFIKQHCFHPS